MNRTTIMWFKISLQRIHDYKATFPETLTAITIALPEASKVTAIALASSLVVEDPKEEAQTAF